MLWHDRPSVPLRGWRRIARAVWGAPNDPQIYGSLEVPARALLAFIESARARGHHLTPTHLVGCALGRALEREPGLNVRLVGDRVVARAGIDVFFITAVGGGSDLSGVKVQDIHRKSAGEVARELDEASRRLRQGRGSELDRLKAPLDHLPRPLLRLGLRFAAWAVGERDWELRALGLRRSPFGSAVVSSVGMFGVPMAFAPLSWLYRVPILILVGEIADQPVAVQGRVEVQPVLPICATVDHRYADGAPLGRALRAFRQHLEAPAQFMAPEADA